MSTGTNRESAWMSYARRYWAWTIVVLTLLFVMGVRWRLREMPLERDEGEYAYVGQLMLEGVPPYKTVQTQKLPGTPAAYGMLMLIFGRSPEGIHLGLALTNAASIVLVFLIGRRLLGDTTGATAAVSFGLLTLNPRVLGLAGHAPHFVVGTALMGTLLLLRAFDTGKADVARSWLRSRGAALLFSGLFFGIAIAMKGQGIFFALFGGIYVVWRRVGDWTTGGVIEVPLRSGHENLDPAGGQRTRALIPSQRGRLRHDLRDPARLRAEIRQCLAEVAFFSAGVILPSALMCGMIAMAGVFHEFIFWTVVYPRKYSALIPLVKGSEMARAVGIAMVGPTIALWILPWIGALMIWWEPRLDEGSERLASASRKGAVGGAWSLASSPMLDKQEADAIVHNAAAAQIRYSTINHPRFFLSAFLVCSILAVVIGSEFRPHDFILLTPVLSLLAGVAVSRAVYLMKHDVTTELFLALPVLGLFVIGTGAAVIGNGGIWFAMTPRQASATVYGSTLFAEAARAAEYIRTNSAPDAKVVVLGSEPEIYFLSQRRPGTSHISMYPLMALNSFAGKLHEQTIAEIESARPDFLVYVDDDYSWRIRNGSNRRILDWWKGYWANGLDLISTADVQRYGVSPTGGDLASGSGLQESEPLARTGGHLLILAKKK